MSRIFADFDFKSFWDNSEYALENYVSEPLTDKLLKEVEGELGYKLPASYVEFMRYQNGGVPFKTSFPTQTPTSWADNHIAITGIWGIAKQKDYSLGGGLGSQFHLDEWGYPDIGVYFADCPSAGHDLIALDYSDCGRNGEPCVVHIDQEWDYQKTFLAKDFETFIKGLKHDSEFTVD